MTETQAPGPRTRTYSWSDPAATASRVAEITGTDMVAAMNAGELPIPPIMATLDVGSIEVPAEGRIITRMLPQEFHYNPIGTVHGGVLSTLLDTATGCAVHTTLPAGMAYTSLDLNVRFLKPVTVASGMLRCEGEVVSRGRQTALAEARLYDAADRLVAHATSTCLIFPVVQPGRS
jgi:uncharacterized protein (TIGR00369 family)